MGQLLQTTIKKLQDLDQIKQEPAPDYSDPHAALEYIKRRNAEMYERKMTGKKLVEALRRLPKAKRDEFYERAVPQAQRARLTKAKYDDFLNPESETGQTYIWIFRPDYFGSNWQNAIAILEEMVGPEEEERVTDEIDSIIAPTDPLYNDEAKLVYPLEAEIQELKDSLNPLHPDYSLDAQMLEDVNEELAYVADETRQLINDIDGSVNGVKGYQAMVNQANFDAQNQFIGQDLAGGKFLHKFPQYASSEATNGFFYAMDDIEVGEGGLSQEEVEEFRQVKPEISPEIKEDVLDVVGKMEQLGEQEYRNAFTNTMPVGGGPEDLLFFSEQGMKLYAYWPLYNARTKLEAAVRGKDIIKIREAHEKYKEVKETLDEMLEVVHKHPTGLSEGNINSTRDLGAGSDEINPVPLEHMEDFQGHSQLNGLFCFYALSKNTKTSPQELLEDPCGAMKKAGESHVKRLGMGSWKTAGEKLYWGLSDSACDLHFHANWNNHTGQLCNRGFDAIANLSSDPKERARIAGTGLLAIASGSIPVKEHVKEWHKLANSVKAQQELLYQHAVLLPEEEFKPADYAAAFGKPDWKQKLDTNALIERLKAEGKLDYGKLADRVNEIMTQANTCNKDIESKYSGDGLIVSCHKLFKDLIKKATPEERETEGFKKLEAYTGRMLLDTASFKREQRKLTQAMDVQREEKKGLFLSSENSPEQKKMMEAQNLFRFKVLQMQGQALPETLTEEDKNYLKNVSLQKAYETAREATFDYCVGKTDGGKSRFFVHRTGSKRLKAAESGLEIMDKMADALELRTPAQKLIDEARQEVYDDRREDEWTPDQAERAAAKLMYAMTLQHQNVSPEEQKKRLAPNTLEMGIAYIRGQDAFKKMVKNEGADKIADYVAEGHGKLTDAYVRGMNSAAREQNREAGKDPKQMSAEEKSEVWKQQKLQM